jgi:hypothetical protein
MESLSFNPAGWVRKSDLGYIPLVLEFPAKDRKAMYTRLYKLASQWLVALGFTPVFYGGRTAGSTFTIKGTDVAREAIIGAHGASFLFRNPVWATAHNALLKCTDLRDTQVTACIAAGMGYKTKRFYSTDTYGIPWSPYDAESLAGWLMVARMIDRRLPVPTKRLRRGRSPSGIIFSMVPQRVDTGAIKRELSVIHTKLHEGTAVSDAVLLGMLDEAIGAIP